MYENEPIRQQDHFYVFLSENKQNLLMNAEKACVLLQMILEKHIKVLSKLSEPKVLKYFDAISDIEEQIEYLIFAGFIDDVDYHYLQQYPGYLDSILKRIDKLENNADKDKQTILLIEEHWNRIKKLVDNAYETENFSMSLFEYRWMMEELRISLIYAGTEDKNSHFS